jgi:hypothetical protein
MGPPPLSLIAAPPPIPRQRSKTADQFLLEKITAIKAGPAKLVNNRKKRKRCENPD